jgi:hypothetical protein
MSNGKLVFLLVLFLSVSVSVFAQDTSPSTGSAEYWKIRCENAEEVLKFVYNNLELSEENYQNIEDLLNSSETTLMNLEELLNISGEITAFLIEKFGISEAEAMRIETELKNILNATPEPNDQVDRRWRTTAIVEALFIIGGIILIIFL